MTAPVPAALSAGLRRDVELLDALASDEAVRRGGLGVVRLAQQVGRGKSQVSRALRALEAEGLVERDPERLDYRLGWRLYALAAHTAEARLTAVATPHMRRLVAQLNETVHLCVLRGFEVLTLASASPSHAFRGLGWEGLTVPAPLTSAGRVLLSEWPPDALRTWIATHGPTRGGPRLRVRTAADLLSEIAEIKRIGFAAVDEEFEEGLVGVSAPVRDHRHFIVAAINVSAPKGRLGSRLRKAGQMTVQVAQQLSAELAGGVPPGRG